MLRSHSQYLTIILHLTFYCVELSLEVKFTVSKMLTKIIVLVQVDPLQGLHSLAEFNPDELVALATVLLYSPPCHYQL